MSDPTNEERVKETLWAFGDAGPDDIDELLEQLPKGVQTSLPDSAGRPYAGLTALGIAAGFNADPRVTRLLLARHMASPDGAPGQRTPLMSAASSGRADVCQMLIEAGADLNLQNKYGFTALHIACTRGELEVAQALVEAGACTDIQTKDESTPLHFAIEDNHPDLAWVVRSQSAIQAINHSDQRAFDLARERSLGSDGDLLQVLDTAQPSLLMTELVTVVLTHCSRTTSRQRSTSTSLAVEQPTTFSRSTTILLEQWWSESACAMTCFEQVKHRRLFHGMAIWQCRERPGRRR